jgi:hypothetical protein
MKIILKRKAGNLKNCTRIDGSRNETVITELEIKVA